MKQSKLIRKFREAVQNQIESLQNLIRKNQTDEDGFLVIAKKGVVGVTAIEGSPTALEYMLREACERDPAFSKILIDVAVVASNAEIINGDLLVEDVSKDFSKKVMENPESIKDTDVDKFIDEMLKGFDKDKNE